MPPKKNQNRSKKNNKNKAPISGDALSNCVLPRDLMALVLTRLPVKSILRFKSVCKPWYKLFSNPNFIKMHIDHFPQNPKNEGLIIYSDSTVSPKSHHTMSLFNIESPTDKTPTQLDHPFCQYLWEMDFVGCVNGLVCLAMPPYGQWIDLWNPGTKFSKHLPLPRLNFGDDDMVSLGFGYDADEDDFKVVRIVCLKDKKEKGKNGFEVYSAKSDSWTTIDVVFDFGVSGTRCGAIVKGNPYWVAKVDENGGVLMCFFDVAKMVFGFVPLSTLDVGECGKAPLVDWNGSLALLALKRNGYWERSIDVWVFDDSRKVWTLKHTFGPIEFKVDRILQCSKNGKILGDGSDGKLFAFDCVDGSVKEIVIDGARKYSYYIYGYTESLAFLKGMKKVVVKKGKENAEDDDEGGPEVNIESFMSIMRNFPMAYSRPM